MKAADLEAPAPGEVVGDGRFELISTLGEGGTSVVYRAHDCTLGIEVALKLLLPRYVGRPEREQRLINEADYLRRLQGHPHVVAFLASGRLEDRGRWPWLATEVLIGDPLDLVFVRGKLELPRILSVAKQVASGLLASHVAGVVHRDATPSNVFVLDDPGGPAGPGGAIKLFDFSHAADLCAPQLAVGAPGRLTGVHDVPGTLGYMGPEQVRQASADPTMDVFGFGVLLFELVTRQNPYAHVQDRSAYIQGQREGSLEAPRLNAWAYGVPEALAQLVDDCTKRLGVERPTMEQIIERLESIDAVSGAAPAREPGPETTVKLDPVEVIAQVTAAREFVPETTMRMDPVRVIAQRQAAAAIGAWGAAPTPTDAPAVEPASPPVAEVVALAAAHPACQPDDPAEPTARIALVGPPQPAGKPDPQDDRTDRLAFARPPQLRPAVVIAPAPEPVPEPAIEPAPEPTPDPSSEAPPLDSRRAWLWWLAAVALLLLGLIAFVAWPGIDEPGASARAMEPAKLTGHDEPQPEPEPPALEPVPEVEPPALEPVPEVEPKPKPKPQIDPQPRPQPDACDGVADQARRALADRKWKRALSLSSDRKCWSSQAERASLRVAAFSELGEWSNCVEAGSGSTDPKTRAKVDGCRLFATPETSP